MFKRFPLLSRLCLFILLPVSCLFITGYAYLDKSQPKLSGDMTLSGLDKTVEVTFDQYGTPTVLGQSDLDVYFAQGYLHASERMWQMELQRRLASGRMSEVMGIEALPSDIWMRTLNVYGAAETALKTLSPEAMSVLSAYADGVNEWLATTDALPPEFLVAEILPARWQPADSIAWQKIFALNLDQNMGSELLRLTALDVLTPKQLKTFYPDVPYFFANTSHAAAKGNVSSEALTASSVSPASKQYQFNSWAQLSGYFKENLQLGEAFTGSNGWVVSGKHTQSGLPILANDPHLSIQQPSVWFALQMKGGKLNVSGMSLVGIPGVMLGRNVDIAWGATSLSSDQQDLFILDILPENNASYLTENGPIPITTKVETFIIRPASPTLLHKKNKPIDIKIRTTDLGPIITDVIQGISQDIVLRWSALDDQDHSFEAFHQLQYASNWSQFRQAVSSLKSPGLQFIFADNQGNIGSQVAGKFPKRGAGLGVMPQSAANKAHYWQGYSPFDQLPYELNPTSDIVVAANSKVESLDEVILSHDWAAPTRKIRISELLMQKINEGKKLTNEDMVAIQMDQLDLGAKKLLPLLQSEPLRQGILDKASEQDSPALALLDEIAQWHGDYSQDSIAAGFYAVWLEELKMAILGDELDPNWSEYQNIGLSGQLLPLIREEQLLDIINNDGNLWCQGSSDADTPLCYQEIVDSFFSAIDEIEQTIHSNDLNDWRWGGMHYVEYKHKPFGQIKLLEKLFTAKEEIGGSVNTVNVANAYQDETGKYQQTLGASFRQLFDLGASQGDRYIISTGQSGHFMSSHYQDMLPLFIKGNLSHFGYFSRDDEQAIKNSRNILTLIPGAKK